MSDNFWADRNVFVTGASGVVGSWLVQDLVQRGANVVTLIRDLNPRSQLYLSKTVDKTNVVMGKLEKYFDIKRTLNEYEINTVFHLGAQTIVNTAIKSPMSTFKSNISGTWNILEAIRNSKSVENSVIASTDKVYGDHENLPYTEDHELRPMSPYDSSKACADILARTYFGTYGIPLTVTRCGNIYGGGDLNFSRIIPKTIKSALFNQPLILTNGGNSLRDYLHVLDVVNGYIKLAENLHSKKLHGQVFNFGANKPYSTSEIVSKILQIMNSNFKPTISEKVDHEIKNQCLSNKKAKELLNWEPKVQIDEGLKNTVSWYKDFFEKTK